jgi:hypothetical protein
VGAHGRLQQEAEKLMLRLTGQQDMAKALAVLLGSASSEALVSALETAVSNAGNSTISQVSYFL